MLKLMKYRIHHEELKGKSEGVDLIRTGSEKTL